MGNVDNRALKHTHNLAAESGMLFSCTMVSTNVYSKGCSETNLLGLRCVSVLFTVRKLEMDSPGCRHR